MKLYFSLLRVYLAPQWPRAMLLAVSLFISIGLGLLVPQILRDFIDGTVAGETLQTLLFSALLYWVVAIAKEVFATTASYLGENVAWSGTNALRLDLLRHCLKLDQPFHKKYTTGELLERIDGDVQLLSNFLSQFIIQVLGNLLMMVGIVVLLFREGFIVGLGASLFIVFGLLIMFAVHPIARPYWTEVRELTSKFIGFLSEHLVGIDDIHANGARQYVIGRFDTVINPLLPARVKANLASSVLWTTSTALLAIANATAFAVNAILWRQGAITIGTVYLIFYYISYLNGPVSALRGEIEDLQQAAASIHRINELLSTRSQLADNGQKRLPHQAHDIVFENVSFRYDEESDVLKGISFRLGAGRTVGILGRTGSGKTTLARLLLRLYDPTSGTILVGGILTTDIDLVDFRRQFSSVTQNVQLFHASVRNNLTFFDPAISDAQILAVLEELSLRTWLDSLEGGLDYMLQGGADISSGQAQLLAFARVFLTSPNVVVLDEASSRVDPATEQMISRAVDKLLYGRTGVIIAHHLNTIQHVDDILILENGRIVEFGKRIVLADDPTSKFSHLLQTNLEEGR